MVTNVYLVRHAEAMGNVLEFFQGRCDVEISPKGEKQLECLAKRFSDIRYDAIYSSPLVRAMQTAEAINSGHDNTIIVDSELVEIDAGEWEGVKWSELPTRFPVSYELWTNRMQDFHTEKGETMTQVYERITKAIDRIASENVGKTVVIVSHGCALRNFISYASGDGIEGLGDVGWSDNTAVSLVRYDDDMNISLVFKNDSSHLSDGLSTLASSSWCEYDNKDEE